MGHLQANGLADAAEVRAWQISRLCVTLAFVVYMALWGFFSDARILVPQYLIFHTFVEMVSVVVAALVAGIVWNAYASERPGNLVLLGVLLFGTGLLDFAHMLSVPGMPFMITTADVQKSISFWLAARVLPAIGLCVCAVGLSGPLRNARTRFVMAGCVLVYVVLVYQLALFRMDVLPVFFSDSQGLTATKLAIEYVLVAAYGFAAVRMYFRVRRTYQRTMADLFVAAAFAALAEMYFTMYRAHGDLFNLVGHIYKVIGYIFIFRAVFASSVRQPFESLRIALANERHLAAHNESVVRTLDLLEEGVIELDANGHLLGANAGWRHLVGTEMLLHVPLAAYVHPDDRAACMNLLGELRSGSKDDAFGRFRVVLGDQADKWIDFRFAVERNTPHRATTIHGVMRDITKVYLQERHINYLALHDALTGLPNRVLLEDRIRQAIHHALRSGGRVALCLIDLDHFKDINDAYGHKTGDAVLVAIVRRIRACLREGDTLARWGGDEFVVLLPDLHEAGVERPLAQKMVAAMREPLEVSDIDINSFFSMGVAIYPDDEASGDVDALLARADRAMTYAKSQGRNNYQLYAEVLGAGNGRRNLYIQAKLAKAIHGGQITAWYQPLIDAQSVLAGQPMMKSVEVLARWQDDELGWVAPSNFIAMAENLGLIGELGAQVRRSGFAALQVWLKSMPNLQMAINVSKRQLFSANFISDLLDDVHAYGLAPGNIVLEITESVALNDVANADEHLRQLAGAGFTLSIDDFGTGYASLSQLHDIPIGELKIDISFVRRLHTEDGYRMVQGILGLAKALRLSTVAEGVENQETARMLAEMGVDLLQGYHFARPCALQDFGMLSHLVSAA